MIQAALSFTRQPSTNLDAALDAFGRGDCLDVNCEVLSRCIPYSSTWPLTQLLARLLPVTDNDIAIACQTEYWLSFIYKGTLALYSVAMFADTHTCKKMKLDRHPRDPRALPEEQRVKPAEPGPSSGVPLTQLRDQGEGGWVLEAVH